MQDSALLSSKNNSTCPVCGKPVVKKDIRDRKPAYCGRVCAANGRYSTRYRGTSSGLYDRPKDMASRTKF